MSGHVRPSEQQSGTSIVPTQQGPKCLLTRNKFLVVLGIKVAVVISAETLAYQTSKSYSLGSRRVGPQAGQSPACFPLYLGLLPPHFLITLCLPIHIHPALGCQGPFGEAHVLLATAYTP